MEPTSRITTTALAKHLGLAPTTVAHVLAGRGERVRIKPETQQRILKAAEELGYRPNTSARAMSTGQFHCAALIQPEHHLYLPATLIRGLSSELEQQQMHLAVAHMTGSDEDHLPKIVREVAVDGLFFNALVEAPPVFFEAVAKYRIPTIYINYKRDCDAVYPDDYQGAVQATRHLLELGHHRIAYCYHNADNQQSHYSVHDRKQGYIDAMCAAGRTPWCHLIAADRFDSPISDRVTPYIAFLSQSDPPTAIVAYEMETAQPVLMAAATLGRKVPDELSIITFCDVPSRFVGLPVTTMCLNMEQIGVIAARTLTERIRENRTSVAAKPLLPTFFPGITCAPPMA